MASNSTLGYGPSLQDQGIGPGDIHEAQYRDWWDGLSDSAKLAHVLKLEHRREQDRAEGLQKSAPLPRSAPFGNQIMKPKLSKAQREMLTDLSNGAQLNASAGFSYPEWVNRPEDAQARRYPKCSTLRVLCGRGLIRAVAASPMLSLRRYDITEAGRQALEKQDG